MDAKINARKVIAKRDRNRVLGAFSYVAGFPLLILVTFIFSIPFIGGSGFVGLNQYYGVLVCVAAWLVLTIVQIIAAIVTKNCTARGVIVIVFTLVVMVGAPTYFDIWAAKKVDEARVGYVRDLYGLADDAEVNLDDYSDLDIKTYNYQINHYVNWTSDKSSLTGNFNDMVDEFCRVYNVKYEPKVKGKVNTDGSEYGEALERTNADGETYKEYWFGEKGAYYKENGLYADGYIFSASVANEILITYYETQEKYKSQKGGADKALEEAVNKATQSTAWKNYTQTEEYKAAYDTGGVADSYRLTDARIEEILKTLGVQIVDNKVIEGLPKLDLVLATIDLRKIVENLLDEIGLTKNDLKNLSLEKVSKIIDGLGLSVSGDDLMALLGGYRNYEVSNVKPVIYFIEDETLRTYAYAKYFGQTHGANIGSVLIPTETITTTYGYPKWEALSDDEKEKVRGGWTNNKKDENGSLILYYDLEKEYIKNNKTETGMKLVAKATTETVYSNIGKITMSDSGLNYKENAFELKECYKLRALNSYVPKLFPLFAARRYAYIFAGIISLMYVIFYYSRMKTKLLGKKLEKMSMLGGAR